MTYLKWLAGFLLCLPLLVLANTHEDLSMLTSKIKAYVAHHVTLFPGETLKTEITHLDSRLKLPKCDKAVKIFAPHTGNRHTLNTIGITCTSPKPWTIYIPIRNTILSNVVVSTRNLSRGHVIQPGDVKIVQRDRSRLRHGYYNELKPVLGFVVARNIRAGRVVTQRTIKAQPLVRRGQMVIIVAKSGTVHIEMKGIAKSNGGLNRRIKVMNVSSKRIIDAIVIGEGKVQVIL